MLRKLFFSFTFLFAAGYAFGQDTIHLMNHETIVSKVLEINPKQVKYKQFSYPDGPVYVINKSSVDKIVFADGREEFFHDEGNAEIENVHPWTAGLNTFDLMFGFVSVSGEYYFPKRGISVRVPVSLGLHGIKGGAPSDYYNNQYYYYNHMKIASGGVQLLFFPGHLHHQVNYFAGLSLEYGRSMSTQYYYDWYYQYNSRVTNDWFGTGLVNGIRVGISDRLNLGISAVTGLEVVYRSYQQNGTGVTTVSTEPMGRLDFTFGFLLGKIKTKE